MGFISQYFGREPEELTQDDLNKFLSHSIEESLHLDYKSIAFWHDPNKLSQHVCAFANAEGGLIILGISETKRGRGPKIYPGSIEWGEEELTRERLESMLIDRISPPIEGLRIHPLRNKKGRVIFLIDVPASERAPHMAADYRYYCRQNFQKRIMEHYQVADMFGKRRRPDIELSAYMTFARRKVDIGIARDECAIRVDVTNYGKAVAKSSAIIIFPSNCFFTSKSMHASTNGGTMLPLMPEGRLKFELGTLYPEVPETVNEYRIDFHEGDLAQIRVILAAEDMPTKERFIAIDSDMITEFIKSSRKEDKISILDARGLDDLIRKRGSFIP